MSDHPTVSAPGDAENHRGLRAVALVAVIIGVLALAAAAFLLSYSGIHAIARTAGVTPSLARLYPLILDAMLVIACAAVLSLRGAGLLARCYAWLSMLVLLAAVAGADALHATGTRLPQRPAAAAVAIIPWALLLIGFGLLLSMLRYARQRMIAAQRVPVAPPVSQGQQRIGINDLLTPRASEHGPAARSVPRPELTAPAVVSASVTAARPAAATPANVTSPPDAATADVTGPADVTSAAEAASTEAPSTTEQAAATETPSTTDETRATEAVSTTDETRATEEASTADHVGDHGADQGADLAIDSEPEQDDPTSDEASLGSQPAGAWVPQARTELPAQDEVAYSGGYPATGLSPAPTADYAAGAYATSSPDTGAHDTGAYDTAAYDTGAHDTAAYDTGAHDTAAYDTGSYDTGTYEIGSYDAAGGEPTGAAAQDQPAEQATLAQPERAVLPPFLRKRSSPTPPED